jgi:hypothetical protein
VGLDEHAPRLVAAAGAAGDLLDLLEAALGRAQIAALQAEIGIDHADQRQIGEVIALGHQLRADDDVDLARLPSRDELGGALRRPDGVGRDDRGARVREQPATSSAMRSTPGPQATRLSSSPHSGQALGGGITWPQWWQASRCISRCSTIQAVQLGHWKRWPQWRHRVSGAKPRRLRNSSDCSPRSRLASSSATSSAPASGRAAAGPGQVDRAMSGMARAGEALGSATSR